MKKAYFIFFLVFFTFIQQRFLSQTHFEGNKIITPYYGFPNFGKLLLSEAELNGLNSSLHSFGPCGLRAEYLISNNVGVGFDFIYNSYNLTYTREESIYNGNIDKWITEYTPVEKSMKRFRFQFRYNYHFDSSNPNFDWYYGIGVGSNSRIYKNKENGIETPVNQTNTTTDTTIIKTNNKVFPISARFCGGLNYFFYPQFAVGCEIGFGGPLFSLSLSYKIY